jgi:tetratricopeptide (TPR) repeat protein
MPPLSTDRANLGHPPLGARLDSWKEIASYLRRGERTVKRWEAERGLPIHRVPGGGRGSVYAYTAELTEWLDSSKDELPDGAREELDEAGPEEASGIATAAEAASPIRSTQGLRVFGFGLKRKWLLAIVGMAVICTAGTAGMLAAFRTNGLSSSFGALPLFRKSQPTADSKAADPERRKARDLYLKGRFEWSQRTPESLNRALDFFTQSIVHDPGYAQAYVGLADTYNLLHIYSTLPLADSYPRAIAAAKRAVELDDSLAEAHRALAFAEFYGAGDYVGSEKEFRRAIELNPKDPVTRRWYAAAFAFPGRFEESLEQFEKSRELDPASQSTLSDEAIVLFNSGKREESIALLKDVERNNPGFYSVHFYRMVISLETHDFQTFLDEGQKAAEVRSDPVLKDIIASAREGYARNGESGLLKHLYVKQKEYYEKGKYSAGFFAKTCVALGKRQEALDLLYASYSRHEADALWLLAEPDLLTLKDEPRYKELVKKINFPQAPGRASTSTAAATEFAPTPPAGSSR